MKVLFIFPIPRVKGWPRALFSYGIGYLSAVLKQSGHKTDLLTMHGLCKNSIRQKIKLFFPGLIAISSTTEQIKLSRQIIEHINKVFRLPIILGGSHATFAPEETIAINGLSGICLGEGEYALLELVEYLESGKSHYNIKNFWFKDKGRVIKNELRPLILDLDTLPFPDREIFDIREALRQDLWGMQFMGSRGCLNSCTNCSAPSWRKIYSPSRENYIRQRGVDNLLEEILYVTGKYNYARRISFGDDCFTADINWLREFSRKYSRKIAYPFRCNVRADQVDEESVDLLKKANCSLVRIGVETGDEHIRNAVLKKGITDDDIFKAVNLARNKGIKIFTFNMLGVPFETEETIKKTISLNKKIKPDIVTASIFRPYPGTELYKLCKERRWIRDRNITHRHQGTVLDQPTISAAKVSYYARIFAKSIFGSKWLFLIKFIARFL